VADTAELLIRKHYDKPIDHALVFQTQEKLIFISILTFSYWPKQWLKRYEIGPKALK
jgi:hypothetical protein